MARRSEVSKYLGAVDRSGALITCDYESDERVFLAGVGGLQKSPVRQCKHPRDYDLSLNPYRQRCRLQANPDEYAPGKACLCIVSMGCLNHDAATNDRS